jgi:hypothetical protein
LSSRCSSGGQRGQCGLQVARTIAEQAGRALGAVEQLRQPLLVARLEQGCSRDSPSR